MQVKINFLMVGHTHEDIDQFFSKIRDFLLKHNVCTLDGNVTYYFMNVYVITYAFD